MATELTERFWAKVDRRGPDECWLWTASVDGSGYGKMLLDGKFWRASRLSFLIHIGNPGRLDVCHRCDTPRCVNPRHLFLGTRQDNMDDCVAKRRHAHGERAGGVKLSSADVANIRRSGDVQRAIAKRYGVSPALITLIKQGKVWRHVWRTE